jgi:uncharacterized protein (DUF2236 family)
MLSVSTSSEINSAESEPPRNGSSRSGLPLNDSQRRVLPADLERLLSGLSDLPGDPRLGFFGPDSVSWRVNRESAIFLGAGRAALLQLAHPWVATSLIHHSNLLNDAIGRFHSTFRVLYTMLFGSRAQAVAASRQLYRRHSSVRGQLPHAIGSYQQGEHYQANEISALRWVHATLIDSAIKAYEFVMPALTTSERDRYYAESRQMAALFGMPPEALPGDWAAFAEYVAAMFDSPLLAVGSDGLALGESVLSGAGTWIRPPHWYRALTLLWMPPRLREEFALPCGEREQIAVRRAAQWLPRIYPHLPGAVRFVGPFHEAQARLRNESPGFLTRKNNCFWMGQPHLQYSELAE